VTGHAVKYVEVGIFINSEGLENASEGVLLDMLRNALFDVVSRERVKLSKVLNFAELDCDIRSVLLPLQPLS
jgi:hypothetical protein